MNDAYPDSARGWVSPSLTVVAGGAVGTLLRASLALTFSASGGFPWWTAAGNVAGALLLGLLVSRVLRGSGEAPWLRDFLGVGVLGGFTTFSALVVDLLVLTEGGSGSTPLGPAALYLGVSLLGGLGALQVGLLMGKPEGAHDRT